MLTYYCPNCWVILKNNEKNCPNCAYDLSQFSHSSYEDKLITALGHPVQERQFIAAQVLGEIGSVKALPAFLEIVKTEKENYFLVRAVLEAAAKIPSPLAEAVLEEGTHHPSPMIQKLAQHLRQQRQLLARLRNGSGELQSNKESAESDD